MSVWRFEVDFTDRAKADYQQLRTVAETYVSLRPLPSNADRRQRNELNVVEYYDRARKILSSLKNPAAMQSDCNLIGRLSFLKYRSDSGTSVYYIRSRAFWTVTVIHISDVPLDYNALLKVVFSGNAHLLPALGIPVPPIELSRLNPTVH